MMVVLERRKTMDALTRLIRPSIYVDLCYAWRLNMNWMDDDAEEFSHRTVYSKFDKDDVKKIEKNIKAEHVKTYVWCEAEMRGRLNSGDWDMIRQGAFCYVKHKSKNYYVYLLDTYYNAKDTKVCVKIEEGYNAILSQKFVCIFDAEGHQRVHAIFCSVESAKKWYDVFQSKQHKRQNVMPVQNKLNSMLFPHQKHHSNSSASVVVEQPFHFNRIEPTRATAPKSSNAVKRAKSKSENPIVAEDASFNSWNEPRDYVVEKLPGAVLRQVPITPPYPDSNSFYIPNSQSSQAHFTVPIFADEAPPPPPPPRRMESMPQPPVRKPQPTSPPPPMPPNPDYHRHGSADTMPPPPPIHRHVNQGGKMAKRNEEVIQVPLTRPHVEVVPPPERKSSINLLSEAPPPPPAKVNPAVIPPSHVVVNNNLSTNSSAKNKAAPPPPKVIEPVITLGNNVEANSKMALKPLPPTPDGKGSDLNSKQRSKSPSPSDASVELSITVKTSKAAKTPKLPKSAVPPPPPPPPADLFGNKQSEAVNDKPANNDARAELMESIRGAGTAKLKNASKSPVKKAALPPIPTAASGAQPPPPRPPSSTSTSAAPPPPPPPPPPAALLGSSSSGTLPPVSDTRANLMDSIRNFGGIQGIKKVNQGKPKSPASKSPQAETKMDLNSALKSRMASMRKYIESDEEQEEENWD
uniref:WH2 domain-containing protein n=1 Tax=Panagrellus redivivus TaxID=6233 RepID=A0A7E4W784_PANRE